MMKLRHWLEQVATVPMSALPFNKLEMPQLPADVVVGFNTLLLPVLQSNTLSRGHKPAQQTLLAWFPEKKQGTEALQSFFKVHFSSVLCFFLLEGNVVQQVSQLSNSF